ncbi:MAG: heme exporter protein CcmD [Paracoccus sp. (in: a-proteobacteria)]|nr:heme exporter protein CcmD [Paracoccus sp. (in: a-proteobacteria)]
MPEFDQYAATVAWAYGASLALLGGLIWATLARNARARRALEDQETRGRHAR